MLICNGNRFGCTPAKVFGPFFGYAIGEGQIHNICLSGAIHNMTAGEGIIPGTVGWNVGSTHPYTYLMAYQIGLISSRNACYGEATVSGKTTLFGRVTGSATSTAMLTMAPSEMYSNYNVISSTLYGLWFADAYILGIAAGTSTCELASYATGNLEGAIYSYTILSPESLAKGVWNSPIADYTVDGTAARAITTIRGLVHENFIMKDQVYDTNDRLISATVRIFANATDCTNDVNPIDEYTISSSYGASGVFRTVKV